jgi:hypothetical protein
MCGDFRDVQSNCICNEHEGLRDCGCAAQRGLGLDPKSSLAYVILSGAHLIYDWDWAAQRNAREVLRLKPRDPAKQPSEVAAADGGERNPITAGLGCAFSQ